MSKNSCVVPIVEMTKNNDAFRDEVITGKESQLVLMTIQPGDEIGAETHDDHDQILVFVEGEGKAMIGEDTFDVGPNDLVFVHAGKKHNFMNSGTTPLRLYTVYAPPEHAAGTRHDTKAQADAAEGHH